MENMEKMEKMEKMTKKSPRERFIEKKRKQLTNVTFALTPTYVQ